MRNWIRGNPFKAAALFIVLGGTIFAGVVATVIAVARGLIGSVTGAAASVASQAAAAAGDGS